MTQTGNFWY